MGTISVSVGSMHAFYLAWRSVVGAGERTSLTAASSSILAWRLSKIARSIMSFSTVYSVFCAGVWSALVDGVVRRC